MTVGRFQPFTKGHLNMVVEGEAPCIVYQIKPAGIPESLKGYKVAGRVVKKDAVQNVINYLNNPSGELTEQEKELLKRPFTNELVSKELDIIKKNTAEIVEVVYVTNMFEAVAKFNKFILDNKDKYEPQYWMCGDDRIDEYQKTLDKYIASGEPLAVERNGEKFENVITSLKLNTGKGRTEGVSGTDVRKSIINKDKSAFEKIMPKGTGVMFDEFVESFDMFKDKLQTLIKECTTMVSLKDYMLIAERLTLKEKISFNVAKVLNKLFRLNPPTTEVEAIKNIKAFVERQTKGEITVGIKRAKEIKKDLSNCLNKNVPLFGISSEPTIKECFESMRWCNKRDMSDDWQFIVYRKKEGSDNSFVVDDESPYIIASKRADGTRPIKAWVADDFEDYLHDEYPTTEWTWSDRIVYEYIAMLQDFEAYQEKEKQKSEQHRKGIEERINELEKELKKLKDELK